MPAKAVPEAPTAVKEVKQVPEAAPTMKVMQVKEIPPPKMILRTEDTSLLDDRVYNYIAEHGGEVSLSQAAEELGITVHDLNAAIDRLKNQGRLA
jgi:DNA-binding MarR family transcriptional regulator